MYPQLDLAKHTKTTLNINDAMIKEVLKNSYGKPTMSNEDIKLAVLSLLFVSERQQVVIDELVACVNELRAAKPKRWYQR